MTGAAASPTSALAFASCSIAVLAALFFVLDTLYFVCSEEPGLEIRFGQEYARFQGRARRRYFVGVL